MLINEFEVSISMSEAKKTNIAIIGAGPAGLGLGATLRRYGYQDFQIFEQATIGASFKQWHPATRFISPSFTTNGFGAPDLNAITPDTSPAYSLQTTYPTGAEYAAYLKMVAEEYHLPVQENCPIQSIRRNQAGFELVGPAGTVTTARFVVLGLGDFHYPDQGAIEGAELAQHYAQIHSNQPFSSDADPQIIIGGNEAAVDLACHIVSHGGRAALYTTRTDLASTTADPSLRLSERSLERLAQIASHISVHPKKTLVKITQQADQSYQLTFDDHSQVVTRHQPLLATGFDVATSPLISPFFAKVDGHLALTDADESTTTANCFLIGPQVQHGNTRFCYIYKYRQRWAPMAETLLHRSNFAIDPEVTAWYMAQGMYPMIFSHHHHHHDHTPAADESCDHCHPTGCGC